MTVRELVERAIQGDRRATGQLITLVERGGPPAEELDDLVYARTGHAHVIGITGAPGAGKSTLTGRIIAALAARGHRVAVIAVDPSSPITGGAILGDRIRMDDLAGTGNVFIRSMATRGHTGGLALAVPGARRVLDAVGFDAIIVETVGVGQVEVDIAGAADTTLVVVTPGWGDAIQANKAGLLEVADIFVVNKADRAGADDAVRDLDYMLDLGGAGHDAWRAPIRCTTATDGSGVDDLLAAIETHMGFLTRSGELERRRQARARGEVRAHLLRAAEQRIDALLDATEPPAGPPAHVADVLARRMWGNMTREDTI